MEITAKGQARSDAAKKGFATRVRRMKEGMETVEITIVRGLSDLEIYGIASRSHGGNYMGDPGPFRWSNEKARNAIRHRLTNYEDQWARINRGSTGAPAYRILRERVEAVVDQAYPQFAPGAPEVNNPLPESAWDRETGDYVAWTRERPNEASQTVRLRRKDDEHEIYLSPDGSTYCTGGILRKLRQWSSGMLKTYAGWDLILPQTRYNIEERLICIERIIDLEKRDPLLTIIRDREAKGLMGSSRVPRQDASP